MQQVQNADTEALGILYERLRDPLYCFLYRYTKEEQLSIDIVHDTFEVLQKKKATYVAEKGTVKAFVFQVAYRIMINKLNRRKRWQRLIPFLVPTTEPKKLEPDETLLIQLAITALPDKQRAVILLAYYEDLPIADIAQILDIPAGTVKSRLHHAMKALKEALKEDFLHEK